MGNDLVPIPSITVTDGKITDNLNTVEVKVREITERYTGLVVTDVKAAKDTLASLRKLSKAINDERIKAEKAYLEPFEAIKARVETLKELIATPIASIDTQIKDAEKAAKEKRVKDVEDLIAKAVKDADFDEVMLKWFAGVHWRYDQRWTLESYWTIKGNPTAKLTAEIEDVVKTAKDGVATIMAVAGEFTDQILDDFKYSGNLGTALGTLEKKKQAKAEAEAFKARQAPPEPMLAPEPPQAPTAPPIPEVELPQVTPPEAPVEEELPAFMMDVEPPQPAFMGPAPTGDRTFILKVVCSDAEFSKVRTAFALAKVGFEVVETL